MTALREPALSMTALREPALSMTALREPALSMTALREPALSMAALRELALSMTALREPALSMTALREPALSMTGTGPCSARPGAIPRRESPDQRPIVIRECALLLVAPAFELLLKGDRVVDMLELTYVHEPQRPP
jgi:hypothetical protein